MTIKEIKQWADENRNDKNKTIVISGETLFNLLKDVCYNQFLVDKTQFENVLHSMGFEVIDGTAKA